MERIFNFSSGPATLPLPVLEQAREDIISYRGCGIGIAELSHRSKQFEEILSAAKLLVSELLGVPANYEILFLTGGATNQFSMVPMNLLPQGRTADYLLSGFWAERAHEEAQKFGNTHVACSGKDRNYTAIPKTLALSSNPAYVHFTSNNTIYGTEFHREPETGGAPLICDASSDIFSRRLALEKYGAIYAGAQKNLGPAGVTLVILRGDLLERSPKNLPILLDYNLHVKYNSNYNTAPVLPIYMVREVLEWLKGEGGLPSIERRNSEKAKILYAELDSNAFFCPIAEREDRSLMNVTFRLQHDAAEPEFLEQAEARGLNGLKGHRVIGGLRASIYNAFPKQGVEALVSFMREFSRTRG